MSEPKTNVFTNGATGKVMLEASLLGDSSVIVSHAWPSEKARQIGAALIAEADKAKKAKVARS